MSSTHPSPDADRCSPAAVKSPPLAEYLPSSVTMKIACMTQLTANWTILSSSAAMSNGLFVPSDFGVQARFDGSARYRPPCTRSCRSVSRAAGYSPYSAHVTPSMPADAERWDGSAMASVRQRRRWAAPAFLRLILPPLVRRSRNLHPFP